MMDVNSVIEYMNENKTNGSSIGSTYKTLKACKIASYFRPYIAWYEGCVYVKGKNLICFGNKD